MMILDCGLLFLATLYIWSHSATSTWIRTDVIRRGNAVSNSFINRRIGRGPQIMASFTGSQRVT